MDAPRPDVRISLQRGTTVVEFALCSLILFTFIFGTIEVARVLFVWNAMAVVTSGAARSVAMANFNDATDVGNRLTKSLGIAAASDRLFLADDITHENLVVEYLRADGVNKVQPLPPCPAMNVVNCLADPNGDSCIRFVRVRLCQKDTACEHVPYVPMFALPGMDAFNLNMPWFSAVAPVETLGMPGACT